MKRTFVKLKGTIRQSASLPDATLRPHRWYTTADRQAVPGLLSGTDVLSVPLWVLCGSRRASARCPPETLSASRVIVIDTYSQSGSTRINHNHTMR